TERFGCLQVDHELVFGRRLYRKVGRLLALEDAIDVARRGPVLVDAIGRVGGQAEFQRWAAFARDILLAASSLLAKADGKRTVSTMARWVYRLRGSSRTNS